MVSAGCAGPGASTVPPPVTVPAVDVAATPPGWTAVAVGDAQLSVPPGSQISYNGCTTTAASVTVFLAPIHSVVFCWLEHPTTTVQFAPLPAHATTRGERAVAVNGIATYPVTAGSPQTPGPSVPGYEVPSLGVQITADGPMASKVLATLTRSPRAVALAAGPAPPVPSSWRRVTWAHISVAVPPAWPVQHVSTWPGSCTPDATAPASTVLLVASSRYVAPSCPSLGLQPVPTPVDGVVIGPGEPFGSTGSGDCRQIGGFGVCPSSTDPYSALVASVGWGCGPEIISATIETGLAGTGVTARTILHSLRGPACHLPRSVP